MTATRSVQVISGSLASPPRRIVQSADPTARIPSYSGQPTERAFACSPDGTKVARAVRIDSFGNEAANSATSPVTNIKLYDGTTATVDLTSTIALPAAETSQPLGLAYDDTNSLWQLQTTRLWNYTGSTWVRYPATGNLNTLGLTVTNFSADDGNIYLWNSSSNSQPISKVNLGAGSASAIATESQIGLWDGGGISIGRFQRVWGDGAGGVYAIFIPGTGDAVGASRAGLYQFSGGVVVGKILGALSYLVTITRDVDGHWWGRSASSQLTRHDPSGTAVETIIVTSLTNGLGNLGAPTRGPRCQPIPTPPSPGGLRFNLHMGDSSFGF